MNVTRNAPFQAPISSVDDLTGADRLRDLLSRAGLSQRAAARLLGIEERTMRQWCAGEGTPPASVFRALSPKITHSEHLLRTVGSNETTIAALRSGRITGLGYGPGPSEPQSVAAEVERLLKRNEELRAIARLEQAFQRRQESYFSVNGQWIPNGNALPTAESISALDAAEEEFRAAQRDVDRITQEIRDGKR